MSFSESSEVRNELFEADRLQNALFKVHIPVEREQKMQFSGRMVDDALLFKKLFSKWMGVLCAFQFRANFTSRVHEPRKQQTILLIQGIK